MIDQPRKKAATALITGGAGFIGSHLADALLCYGVRVRILDNLANGRRENVPAGSEFIEGDIQDAAVCKAACAGIDVVYHLAALGSVPRSIADPLRSHRVNTDGTIQILLAARDGGCKRVVYAGSSSVYGSGHALPLKESYPTRALSPYAVSKLSAERYVLAFNACYGLQTVVVRYFNVFGPRQKSDGAYAAVIPRFALALLHGEQAVIYGDGKQRRDFTFVEDAAEGTMLAGSAPGAVGQIINLSGGRDASILDLHASLQTIIGTDRAPRFEPERVGDARDSLADLSVARQILKYDPRIDLETGLRRTVEFFKRPN